MKIIISLLFMMSACAAQAELTQFGQSSGNTSYFDASSVKRSGTKVRVWTTTEFRQREKAGFLSTRSHKEMDCKNLQERTLQFMAYSESKGQGKVVGEVNEANGWEDIVPGTRNSRLLHMVCDE